MPQAKTIKQAKAAYKTRNTANPLTEREQKQLQRSVTLDRRAWSLREREKTRADGVKKRSDKAKKAQDEVKRLGTQMRCDKFGFKGSQFHLGAFFGKAGAASNGSNAGMAMSRKSHHNLSPEKQSQDEFDEVDDETLLQVLDSPEAVRTVDAIALPQAATSAPVAAAPQSPSVRNMMLPPPRLAALPQRDSPSLAAHGTSRTKQPAPPRVSNFEHRYPPPAVDDQPPPKIDLDLIWSDFFSTTTQIARELNADDCDPTQLPAVSAEVEQKDDLRTTSFSSGFFDITEEDLEEMDSTPKAKPGTVPDQAKIEDIVRMPSPPPLSAKRAGPESEPHSELPKKQCGASTRASSTHHTCAINTALTHTRLYGPPSRAPSANHTLDNHQLFTLTQLNSFIDADLQLTQIDPH